MAHPLIVAPPLPVGRTAPVFSIGSWRVDPGRCVVSRGSDETHIEPKVMDVLVLLARSPGQVVSKDELLASAWPGTTVVDGVLTRCICQLRRALADGPAGARLLETIPKRGYRLVAPVSEARAAPAASGAARARIEVGPFREVPPPAGGGAAAEALAELLVVELARLPGVVAVRAAPDVSAGASAEALRVEGAVLRGAARLAVVARAVEPVGSAQVWAAVYRARDAGDALALQRGLARRVAAGLAPVLRRGAARELLAAPTNRN